jgi:O-methyltransferase
MKQLLKKIIAGAGYEFHRSSPTLAPFLTDPIFAALFDRVETRTLSARRRCHILYQLAQQASGQPGDVAEVGVYRGGTAYLLAKAIAAGKKRIHLFDTFEGMPETDPDKDVHQAGDFSDTSLQSVQEYLSECDNVAIYPGFFPETAAPVSSLRFSLVHIDVDIYRSVLDCCSFFYGRMTQGGFMVFDDYGFLSCPGAKEAVDSFFSDKPEYPCYLPTGQSLVVKV